MADAICRWRNGTPKTIVELVNSLPHESMRVEAFRQSMTDKWDGGFFRTAYQLAVQMGLYYESDDGMYYPRFNHDIDEQEAYNYLLRWFPRYYIPNPYVRKDGFTSISCPTLFLKSLYDYARNHPHCSYKEAYESCFGEEAKNNDDIIRNYINNYGQVLTFGRDGNLEITDVNPNKVFPNMDRNDKKAFFDSFSFEEENNDNKKYALQQISYGAPGTGKSHEIEEVVTKFPHVRTTFHPDSDYASFVGAYKPTMKTNTISRNGVTTTEEQIIYSFVPQAFLKAYVNAWKQMPKPYFLVIEEINRGNCAQIFGDLFQLLDRDDEGFSKYSIESDEDIKRFLSLDKTNGFAALTDEQKKQFPEDAIWKGEKLVLPKNLHIWASMNTSDQSLFPIDSAFKRRWDWKYVPIADGGKEWKIEVCGQQYDWWEFLEEMNAIVEDATSSEDKKLGYYFTKADEDGIISAEKFVSKVIFYLWNDVFKDYGFDRNNANGKPIFKDANGKDMTFRSFFKPNGDIQETQVKLLFENMLLSISSDEEDNDDDEDGGDASGKDFTRYSINGNGQISKRQLAYQLISEYIRLNPSLTATEVVSNWKALGTFVTHFVETQSEFENRTDNNPRVMAADCNGEKVYVSTNGWGTKGVMQSLIDAVNNQDWGLRVEEIG